MPVDSKYKIIITKSVLVRVNKLGLELSVVLRKRVALKVLHKLLNPD